MSLELKPGQFWNLVLWRNYNTDKRPDVSYQTVKAVREGKLPMRTAKKEGIVNNWTHALIRRGRFDDIIEKYEKTIKAGGIRGGI